MAPPPHLPRSSGRVRLTERDHALLAFMAEHRLVLERQLERLVGAGEGRLRGRLLALAADGLVRPGRVFGEPHYQIRPTGLSAIGSNLSAPRFSVACYRHDVGVAWLWLAARDGTFGPLREVIGERRLRSHDGVRDRPSEPYGVRLGGYDRYGNPRLHYPDVLLVDPRARRVALELELTPKGRERRELILGGYGADSRIEGVVYLVEDTREGRSIRRLVGETVRQMDLADRVRFQFIEPIRVMADEPNRGPHRVSGARRPAAATEAGL